MLGDNEQFYCNYLSNPAKQALDIQQIKCQFKHATNGRIEEDGLIMLNLIFDRINLSTREVIKNLTNDLDNMTLSYYDQVVLNMIEKFKTKYEKILAKRAHIQTWFFHFLTHLAC